VRVKIARTAKHNGKPVAYVVKIKGIKFPRGMSEWYFPNDHKPETALKMALNDYENFLVDTKEQKA
tara:strand:+ start:1126 stop:1323 length:198 start_codon:yes stop_codon:yes gene_type:complete